jgi:acyl carrier protein
MDRQAIRAQLMEFVNAETGQELTDLGDDVSLREGLGLDSLDMTSVIIHIENHYQIELSRGELKEIQTAGQLIDAIQAKLPPASRRAA